MPPEQDGLLQSQQKEQPQGNHQLDVVSLQKEKEQDQQQEDIAGIQLIQLEILQNAGQPLGMPGVGRSGTLFRRGI